MGRTYHRLSDNLSTPRILFFFISLHSCNIACVIGSPSLYDVILCTTLSVLSVSGFVTNIILPYFALFRRIIPWSFCVFEELLLVQSDTPHLTIFDQFVQNCCRYLCVIVSCLNQKFVIWSLQRSSHFNLFLRLCLHFVKYWAPIHTGIFFGTGFSPSRSSKTVHAASGTCQTCLM